MGVLAIAAVAAAAVAAAGSGYAAYSQSAAAESQAQQMKAEEDTSRAAAAQEEAKQRRHLMQVIASQDALRAARGGSMTSGTALSIYDDTVSEAEKDINATRLNTLSRADRYRLGAYARRSEATDARVGGYLSIGSTAISGASNAYRNGG